MTVAPSVKVSPATVTEARWLRGIVLAAAWGGMLVSLSSLAVWHSHSAWLLENALWVFETRYNTALLFFACSAGMLACLHGKERLSLATGVVAFLAGSATLLQYLLATDFGLDEWFVKDYPHPDFPYPGRPAPNTAVTFMAGGIFLLLASVKRRRKGMSAAAMEILGFLTFAIGTAALAGYLQGAAPAYTWGGFTRMAPMTAALCIMLGSGFMALAWQRQETRVARVPLWLPPLLCFAALLFDVATPFEIAAGFAYIPLVFCSLWFTRPHTVFVFSIMATLLAVLGYLSSDIEKWGTAHAIINRGLSIATVWFVAALVYLRRKDEIALAAGQSKLRAVVDNAVDGLITINERGIVESFNPAAERIFGYQAQEVVGRNIKMLMPEPYHGEHDGYIRNYLETGRAKIIGTTGREVAARRKDGSVFPIDLAISAFSLDDGKHFSGIIRDITARKEAEAGLARYMQALERSNKELDDFAYIASHDLKEPLRGIHNHARFLLEDNQEKLDSESANRLNRLVLLSQRMEKLVNDLLYFSRLGRQEMAIQPTDMNAVIHDIEMTLETFLEERRARIAVPQKLPTITCDKIRITEALRNLVTNAVKYNDKPERLVEIGLLPQHGQARNVLYVKDNGLGIAPEFHQEIFRIFKRLQSAKDGKEEGTGVGLTFVKKIIERHGGKIWLESEPGKGTVFYFTLEGASYDAKTAA